MAQVIAERRDIDLVLFEQMQAEELTNERKYGDYDRTMFEMVVSEARKFGIKEILPTNAEGDREGIRFEDGRVTIPECFRRPYKLFTEAGWIALTDDPQYGGQELPHRIVEQEF